MKREITTKAHNANLTGSIEVIDVGGLTLTDIEEMEKQELELRLLAGKKQCRNDEEDRLIRDIIEAAHLYGWLVAHFRKAMTKCGNWVTPVAGDGKGFPDLVLVHPELGRVIFAECKSHKGRLTEEQKMWLAATHGCLWTPQIWDEIIEELKCGR